MLSTGLNIWHTSIAHGGAIAPDFPPNVSGTQATIAADFTGNQYWAAGASKASFAAWLTALGGTYSRSSAATYLQGGVVKTAAANAPRFPTALDGTPLGLRLTGAGTNINLHSNIGDSLANYTNNAQAAGTVTGNQPDPSGGSTAVSFIPNTGSGPHNFTDTFGINIAASTAYTFSTFIKPFGPNTYPIKLDPQNGTVNYSWFDLTGNGAVLGNAGNAVGSITKLANGWFLVSVTFNNPSVSNIDASTEMTDVAGNRIVNGDGVSGWYMWGRQYTASAFVLDHIPTTTVPVTQAADSLSFPYTQTTLSVLVGTNGLLLDGTNSQRVVNSIAANPVVIYDSTHFAVVSTAGTFGGPAITNPFNPHKTMTAGNAAATSITSDGQVPLSLGVPIMDTAPTTMYIGSYTGSSNYGSGNYSQLAVWNGLVASTAEMQRLTALPPPPPLTIANASITADFAGNVYAYNGGSKADFAAWLAALGGTYIRSSSATYLQGGVVKTAAANTPRFPTNLAGVPQGIRLTDTATNAVTNSQIFSGANWDVLGHTSLANNVATAPDGTNTATSATETSPGTSSCAFYFIGAGGGNVATLQCFVKAGVRSWVQLFAVAGGSSVGANFNLSGAGSVGFTSGAITPRIIALAGGWYLCSISAGVDINNSQVYFIDSNVNALQPQYSLVAGTIAGYVWGMQLTGTSFPADYIPTTTVAVTQAADALGFPHTKTTFSALLNTGPLSAINYRTLGSDADLVLIVNDSTHFAKNGLVGPAVSDILSNSHKTMLAGNPSNSWLTSDGIVPTTSASPVHQAHTKLYIGSQGGSYPAGGNYSQFTLWDDRVASVADMQGLTT